MRQVICYTDLKSPYAWLALEHTFGLAEDFDVALIWRPYTLDIPDFFATVEERSPHQWRKVKYAYMDCRRQANERGLTLRGPREIYDTRRANIALMYADREGCVKPFMEDVFQRFFAHAIEIEDPAQISEALERAGAAAAGFEAFHNGAGGAEHDRMREEAEELGVFGVPSFLLDGELFWGGDRIGMLKKRLAAA